MTRPRPDEEPAVEEVTDESLLALVREQMSRLDSIDALFTSDRVGRDLAERLGNAAAEVAEHAEQTAVHTRRLLLLITAVMAVGLLLWTPCMAFIAVYGHEIVRNHCYPGAVWAPPPTPTVAEDQPWYCGLFKGAQATGHVH